MLKNVLPLNFNFHVTPRSIETSERGYARIKIYDQKSKKNKHM